MKNLGLVKHFFTFLLCLALPFHAFSQVKRCDTEVDSAFLNQFQKEIQEHINYQKKNTNTFRTEAEVYTIPIVFHIIHQGEAVGQGSNLSTAQIYSQFNALNQDFRRQNVDTARTPVKFKKVATDTQIEFVLAQIDQYDIPMQEIGIHRYNGGRSSWNRSDFERFIKPLTFWNPEQYLNVWITPLSGILGYSQFPSNSRVREGSDWARLNTARETDGVVVDARSFGSNRSRRAFDLRIKYNLGRTLTHEIGHFLGLIHISGDGGCEKDDFCEDTPLQNGNTYDCREGQVTCGNENMVQNFMDYSDDSCMNLFTIEQALRMRTALENGTRRKELLRSRVAQIPTNGAYAWFESDKSDICPNQQIRFDQKSVILGDNIRIQSIQWFFPNGNPTTSSLPNPTIAYSQLGVHDVILIVKSNVNTDTLIRKNFVNVTLPSATIENVQHDFEGSLTKTDWLLIGNSWQRAAVGAQGNSFSCALLRNEVSMEKESRLLAPNLNMQNTSVLSISFDYSYIANLQKTDSFAVMITSDCGNTFRTLWKTGGQFLATAENKDNLRSPPKNNEWKSVLIYADVSNLNTAQIAFVNRNYGGNYFYLDNIVISKIANINNLPTADFTVSPALLLRNEQGIVEENVKGVTTKYEWDLKEAANPTTSERIFYNKYSAEGNYSIALKASNPFGSNNMIKNNAVQVIAGRKLDNIRKRAISVKTLGINGFLSGHNVLKDRAKAEFFKNFGKYEKLYGADILFSNIEIGQANTQLTFAIWDVKNGLPNQIIARKNLNMSLIRQNAVRQSPTRFILDNPIDVPEQFFAGVLLNYSNNEQLAIFTTETTEIQNTAFELNDANVWLPYSAPASIRGKNFPSSHAISPIISPEIGIFDADFANNNIKIFPNPTSNEIKVSFEELNIKSYQIFNYLGQEIVRKQVSANFDKIQLNTFSAGVYLLVFETDKGNAVKKLVLID